MSVQDVITIVSAPQKSMDEADALEVLSGDFSASVTPAASVGVSTVLVPPSLHPENLQVGANCGLILYLDYS